MLVFLFARFLFFSISIRTPYYSNVSFIPYFLFLVFDILVTLVARFSFPFFSRLTHLALQNVNKDYVIFSYFRNFVAKSDQKQKLKNWNVRNTSQQNRVERNDWPYLKNKKIKRYLSVISTALHCFYKNIDYLWEILEGHANDVVNHPVDMM